MIVHFLSATGINDRVIVHQNGGQSKGKEPQTSRRQWGKPSDTVINVLQDKTITEVTSPGSPTYVIYKHTEDDQLQGANVKSKSANKYNNAKVKSKSINKKNSVEGANVTPKSVNKNNNIKGKAIKLSECNNCL